MGTLTAVIIIILLNSLSIWLSHYLGRSGHNAAEKKDIKEISYLSESGKKLATKEDIEEITHKIETIKNEVSFENQRKHQFIEERTNSLLRILRYAEEIRNLHSQLLFLLYDETDLSNLTEIIKETDKVLTDLGHECRITAVTTNDQALIAAIYNLLDTSQLYGAHFCHSGNVHISYAHQLKTNLELYKTIREEGLTKECLKLREAIEKNKSNFNANIKPFAEKQYDAMIEYLSHLKRLYKKDFHIRLNFEDTTNKNRHHTT